MDDEVSGRCCNNNNVLMNRPNKYLFKNFISIDLELTNSLHNKIIIKIIIRQIQIIRL